MSLSFVSLGLIAFSSIRASAKVDSSDPCSKEIITPNGYVRSSQSPFYVGSGVMCDVTLSNGRLGSQTNSALSYDFQAGGLLNLNESGRIYSYQLITPTYHQNQFSQKGSEIHLSQGTLDWGFSKKDFSLESVTHSPTGSNCLTGGKSDTTMELGTSFLLDLGTCEGVLAINLGSSTTKQTAALKRNEWATISGVVDGAMRSCRIQIGHLFHYRVVELKTNQNTVVDGSDPCYMYMVKEFAHLPPKLGFEEFYKRHPNHSCRQMARGTVESVRTYRDLPSGLTPLSPDQDIDYRLRSVDEIRALLQTKGKGEGCRVLAPELSSNTGGSVSKPSRARQ